MRLGELQDKDIISIEDGKLIGSIVDVNVGVDGVLTSMVVCKRRFFFSWFTRNEIEISWKQIEKIGSDVILVKL